MVMLSRVRNDERCKLGETWLSLVLKKDLSRHFFLIFFFFFRIILGSTRGGRGRRGFLGGELQG